MQKSIDGIKAPARNNWEQFKRWSNHQKSVFLTITPQKRIAVKYIDKLPDFCQGRGRTICEQRGEHSWFFHAMDKAY